MMSDGHVLILGEKSDTGRFVREQLENSSLDVIEQSKLDRGISMAMKNPPWLMVINGDTEDGLQAVAAIKGDNRLSDVPVVLLSSQTGSERLIDAIVAIGENGSFGHWRGRGPRGSRRQSR